MSPSRAHQGLIAHYLANLHTRFSQTEKLAPTFPTIWKPCRKLPPFAFLRFGRATWPSSAQGEAQRFCPLKNRGMCYSISPSDGSRTDFSTGSLLFRIGIILGIVKVFLPSHVDGHETAQA